MDIVTAAVVVMIACLLIVFVLLAPAIIEMVKNNNEDKTVLPWCIVNVFVLSECIDSILNKKTIGIVLAVLLLVSWSLQMKDALLRNKTKKQSSLNDAEISHLEYLISLRKQEIDFHNRKSIVMTHYDHDKMVQVVKAIRESKGGSNCRLEDVMNPLKLVRNNEPQTFDGIDNKCIETLQNLGCEFCVKKQLLA